MRLANFAAELAPIIQPTAIPHVFRLACLQPQVDLLFDLRAVVLRSLRFA